jgi:hypothetical protein
MSYITVAEKEYSEDDVAAAAVHFKINTAIRTSMFDRRDNVVWNKLFYSAPKI